MILGYIEDEPNLLNRAMNGLVALIALDVDWRPSVQISSAVDSSFLIGCSADLEWLLVVGEFR